MEVTEEKLKEAVKLLEEVHDSVYNGASFEPATNKLKLLEDDNMRNKIVKFIKSTGAKTKLKEIKITHTPITAC